MRNRAGFILLCASLLAASAANAGAITTTIDNAVRVTLAGNTRPEARDARNDRGPVADGLMLSHMQLLLKRSPTQEAAVEAAVDRLYDARSPDYHHWMTAVQFGRQYGANSDDIQKITGWLSAHGFTVNGVSTSRMVIDFSGTAGAVRETFATPVHYLDVKGKQHLANMRDPQIPAALAPAVAGIVSLNDFRPSRMYRARPKYSFKVGGENFEAVTPADLATIYNLKPLFSAGITGNGQTIALIEDSNMYASRDWSTFRTAFGLAGYTSGKLVTVQPAGAACHNPGYNADDGEVSIDAEWASAAAPNATIEIASCADTNTTFGGLIALQNVISASTTPQIISVSYGECEAYNGAAGNAAFFNAYQQAAAEGISVFVSAGDEDGAECDGGQWVSFQGISVSGFASTPYNVAVGGTDFGDTYAKTTSKYWSTANSGTFGSALSYIPEIPWNDSCGSTLGAVDLTGSAVTYGPNGFCNTATGSSFWEVVGGSGGPSGCATGATSSSSTAAVSGTCKGYATPSWQKGVVGLPGNGLRNLPDVSLFAGDGIWAHSYIFCLSDPYSGGTPCAGTPLNWSFAGGTSFASPIMAGIQALVDQKKAARQGNPDPVLYSLAATEYGAAGNSGCNSTKGNAAKTSCVFYDVTLGDNDVNCTSGQLLGFGGHGITSNGPVNCYLDGAQMGVLSTSNTSYKPAYKATTGWDFSTGIGTVNAKNLVNAWP